jgi:hypothetical protein
MPAAPINLEVLQGATFRYPLTWYSGKVMKPITDISSAAPAVVTAAGHGLPANPIPVTITNVKGLRLPATSIRATRIDVSTFNIDLDTTGLGTYRSGGTLTYHAPVNLAGYTALMQIRPQLSSPDTDIILELDESSGITLGGSEGSVLIEIDAATTATLNFASAVYDLELVSPTGVVTRLMEGKVTLRKEVTR